MASDGGRWMDGLHTPAAHATHATHAAYATHANPMRTTIRVHRTLLADHPLTAHALHALHALLTVPPWARSLVAHCPALMELQLCRCSRLDTGSTAELTALPVLAELALVG